MHRLPSLMLVASQYDGIVHSLISPLMVVSLGNRIQIREDECTYSNFAQLDSFAQTQPRNDKRSVLRLLDVW